STIRLRQLPEVDRPVIATVIPTPKGGFVLLDSGANVECRPFHLLQFAVMGSVYSREVLGCAKPRVGLLGIGTEESKGNELTLEAFKFCNSCRPDILNFVGNVEGHDLFAGRVDVVVCDGFIGNIVLKTCESMAAELFNWFKSELQKNPVRRFGALLAKNAFLNIKNRVDPDTYGGAPLLGLNGLVMITHGSAKKKAIKNAVLFAAEAVQHHINEVITDEIQQTYAKLEKDRLISPSTTTS
ncbi:MAG: phosphate acyltransferase, partial [Verrucomicrobia bacterium]|nr:phosphate acyltransferase [Verrucomicrobiota bacterium]